MKSKKNIAIVFGGNSPEHDVSIMSARNVYNAIKSNPKYNIILVGVSENGFFVDPALSKQVLEDSATNFNSGTYQSHDLFFIEEINKKGVDVVLPLIHGRTGEDGSLQGLLNFLNIPCLGCNVLSSALAFNKDMAKMIFIENGIPVTKSLCVEVKTISNDTFDYASKILGLPFFMKPVDQGSSIGVFKIADVNDYLSAIKEVPKFGDKYLLEEFVEGREIECGIIGDDEVEISALGLIQYSNANFYDYNAKYESEVELIIPAPLNMELVQSIKDVARRAYLALGCRGFARVDFFLRADGSFVLNEINTLPGFTDASMFPRLWIENGYTIETLIDRLIEN